MNQLWAPWRMEFIERKTQDHGCIFCSLLKDHKDRENLILFRGKENFVILNKYPYNNGHLMVVPNRHIAEIDRLSESELLELMLLSQKSIVSLKKTYHPEGFNTGMNLGKAAGAGIKDHLHLHIIPRWIGDTNFLPVLSDTKSMPEHLLSSFDRLSNCFGSAT